MTQEQWRKYVIDPIIAISVVLAALTAPTWVRFRNPSYHYYGGLDLGHLYAGVAFYCACLIGAIIARITRLGGRALTLIAVVIMIGLIAWLALEFHAATVRPTV